MNELTFQRNCMKMKSCAFLQTVIILLEKTVKVTPKKRRKMTPKS